MKITQTVCVVTGGASGLGEITVRMLCLEGAKVAVWDTNQEKGTQLEQELGVLFCQVDVCSEGSVKQALERTLSVWSQVHVLVNCAGIAIQELTFKDSPHSLDSFKKVLEVNLIGVFNTSRLVAAQMVSQPGYGNTRERGVIINTSSLSAFEGQRGQVAYSASKAGVAGLSLPMARDLGRFKVRVATIAPGLFSTPMSDLLKPQLKEALQKATCVGRLGYLSEFAHAVKFLIENEYFNGSVLRLDGGMRLPHL